MQFHVLISLVLTFIWSLAAAADTERTADIFAWPLSASKPQNFAKVSFTSTNASIKSFNAPSISSEDGIVRVGFYHTSGKWSGIATAASNFATEKPKRLQLHVKPNGDLYHIGFKVAEGVNQGKGRSTKDGLSVEVMQIRQGPTPHLNKPVVVSADGSTDQKESEKTFLQKYVIHLRPVLHADTDVSQVLVGDRIVPPPSGRCRRIQGGVMSLKQHVQTRPYGSNWNRWNRQSYTGGYPHAVVCQVYQAPRTFAVCPDTRKHRT